MSATIAIVFLFVFGSLLLFKSSYERQLGVLFLLRSDAGLRLIDSLAQIKPSLWNFLADLSVLLSFGGIGGYYLGRYDKTRSNMATSLLFLGLLGSASAYFIGRIDLLGLAFLSLVFLLAKIFLSKKNQAAVDYLSCSLLLGGVAYLILDNFFAFFLGFGGIPALVIYLMGINGAGIITGTSSLPGVSPLIPQVNDEGVVGAGFPGLNIFIPFWYLLIALSVTLIVHEGSHGILARVAKINVKSTGILSLGALPVGAFVEPDEQQMQEKGSVERMRVFSIGSFSNLFVAIISAVVFLGLGFMMPDLMQTEGVKVVDLMQDYPAEKVLTENTVIHQLNGKAIADFNDFMNESKKIKPGDVVSLNTSEGYFTLTAAENPEDESRGYLGVYLTENIVYTGLGGKNVVSALGFSANTLFWIFFFNFNIALVNWVALLPFDGGRMYKEVLDLLNLGEKNFDRVFWGTQTMIGLLFFVNVLPLFEDLLGFMLELSPF